MKTKTFESIRVDGYRGRWSEIDSYETEDGCKFILLEHDAYGDETYYLVCRVAGDDLLLVCETRDDIETALSDSEVI